jgi:hypothetical protein
MIYKFNKLFLKIFCLTIVRPINELQAMLKWFVYCEKHQIMNRKILIEGRYL